VERGDAGERHEPLPSLAALPGWLWRRAGPAGRIGAVVVLLGIVAAAAVFIPQGARTTRENAARDEREAAAAQAARIRATNREQRPHRAHTAAAGRPALLVNPLEQRIRADSAARPGLSPVRRVECDLLDRPSPREGRYSCTAVTAEVIAPGTKGRGITGYPYRALVNARTGVLVWCKVAGQAGEGSYTRQAATPIPVACGG
jgi:type II secretory pathway pseudopilin PulG